MQKINTLVLSGGSIKGFMTLGALQYLFDNYDMAHMSTIIGTSCGSMIAYLLIIGYTPIEIMVYICTHDILPKLSASMDIVSALSGNGAISFTSIHELLEKMTRDKIGQILTLQSLYNLSNKKLVCITYNLTKDCTEYLSYENYPDLPCLTAIRLSSNLPLIFGPYQYNSCYYIDGGITDNLGLRCISENSQFNIAINLIESNEYKTDGNMLDYLYHILSIPIRQLMKNTINDNVNCKIINLIDTYKHKIYDFNIKQEQKFNLFTSGYNLCKNYFKKIN